MSISESPLADPEQSSKLHRTAGMLSATAICPMDMTTGKLLIVEDVRDYALYLQAAVTQWLPEADLVHDGETALDVFDPADHRIVLMNWELPGISGLDLCREIRRRQQMCYTYMIMLTSRAAKTDRGEAMEAGVDDFLTKDNDTDQLYQRLRVADRILSFIRDVNEMKRLIPVCMYCKQARDDSQYWQDLDVYLSKNTEAEVSHGICPPCLKQLKERESW